MEYLTVENFKKSFGGTQVLKGIGFELPKGSILAVIGASGSGKTTLLRCLNFLETPDEGKICLGGEVFEAGKRYSEREIRAWRKKFGLVFQSFNLFPHLTARGNVSLAPDLLARERAREKKKQLIKEGMGRRKASAAARAFRRELLQNNARRADELLEKVGLLDRASAYPHELSGGQQQRVAIARALALEPEILCFDEPTSALDPALTEEVLKTIRTLKGHTMIVVTHEMAFAREVADEVIFMAEGRVEERGTPEEIFSSPMSEKLKSFLKREYYDETAIS